MRILIITPYYLPGFKAGGPVRSLANLIGGLGDEIDFRIIAGDRDLGDRQPYANAAAGTWQPVGKALVAYVPISRLGPYRLGRLIRKARGDVLYLNSFFQPRVFALPLALQLLQSISRMPVVIAPRGGLSPGALSIKSWKKRSYLLGARWLAAGSHILWHATSELEADHIRRSIGTAARIAIAHNMCSIDASQVARTEPKQPGRLRLAFLSRISPKKNLLGAIELMRRVSGNLSFDVYGPIEDLTYWQHCEAMVNRLPANVRVHYRGMVAPDAAVSTLAQYDAMFLPTLGENFGHAIIESLAAGCPVVISNRTPWRDLQAKGAGWDLPLESPADFQDAIAELVAMDESTHAMMRDCARAYAVRLLSDDVAVEQSRRLFQVALAVPGHESSFARSQAA